MAGPLALAMAMGSFGPNGLAVLGGGVLLLTAVFWMLAPKGSQCRV
jgi:hypothetical protein